MSLERQLRVADTSGRGKPVGHQHLPAAAVRRGERAAGVPETFRSARTRYAKSSSRQQTRSREHLQIGLLDEVLCGVARAAHRQRDAVQPVEVGGRSGVEAAGLTHYQGSASRSRTTIQSSRSQVNTDEGGREPKWETWQALD